MKSFNVDAIHSEYGMTENNLKLIQERWFVLYPKWMKIIIRDFEDPFSYKKDHLSGGINIIDLANVIQLFFYNRPKI